MIRLIDTVTRKVLGVWWLKAIISYTTDIMNQVNLTLTGLYENPMDLNNCCGTIDISRQILCFQDKLMAGWGLVILRQNRSMELDPTDLESVVGAVYWITLYHGRSVRLEELNVIEDMEIFVKY